MSEDKLMKQENEPIQSGSFLSAAPLSAGRPLAGNDDSRIVKPGRGSTASLHMWPGLHICRKWKVNSANVEEDNKPHIIMVDIDCRMKEKDFVWWASLFL